MVYHCHISDVEDLRPSLHAKPIARHRQISSHQNSLNYWILVRQEEPLVVEAEISQLRTRKVGSRYDHGLRPILTVGSLC